MEDHLFGEWAGELGGGSSCGWRACGEGVDGHRAAWAHLPLLPSETVDQAVEIYGLQKITLLREISLKTGIQVGPMQGPAGSPGPGGTCGGWSDHLCLG